MPADYYTEGGMEILDHNNTQLYDNIIDSSIMFTTPGEVSSVNIGWGSGINYGPGTPYPYNGWMTLYLSPTYFNDIWDIETDLTRSNANNTVLGHKAGYSLRSGKDNIFIGESAGYKCSSSWGKWLTEEGAPEFNGTDWSEKYGGMASYNTSIGTKSSYNMTGHDNITIGYKIGWDSHNKDSSPFIDGSHNNIYIGNHINEIRHHVYPLGTDQNTHADDYYYDNLNGWQHVLSSLSSSGQVGVPISGANLNNTFIGHYSGYKNSGWVDNIGQIGGSASGGPNNNITNFYP